MNKKIIIKYILLYLPFLTGIGLYTFKIYNLISSILFFIGGYISIKNTIDYRKVKKNLNKIEILNNKQEENIKKISDSNITNVKRTRNYSRVRKRVKY